MKPLEAKKSKILYYLQIIFKKNEKNGENIPISCSQDFEHTKEGK